MTNTETSDVEMEQGGERTNGNVQDDVRSQLEAGDEIEIEYESVYTGNEVTKCVTVKCVMPRLDGESMRSLNVEREDGQMLFLGSYGQVVSTEEREAGIVTKQRRTIGHNVSIK